MLVSQLETPALIVDLDVLEQNQRRMMELLRPLGVALRPHYKSHKCTAIAHMQIAGGAKGITCCKVSEAEVMFAGGAEDIFVRDSHDSARNIQPAMLPESVSIFRGWGRDPYSMMSGIDASFAGAIFTGYHSGAGMNTNPLSHTMNCQNNTVKLNGEICSELMMNCLTASMVGVPLACVCGDKGLCEWIASVIPGVATVPVLEGVGGGTISIHPDLAVKRIREAVKRAASGDLSANLYPMPDHFSLEINFKDHKRAHGAAYYPGCVMASDYTVAYEAADWMDALKFIHWVL